MRTCVFVINTPSDCRDIQERLKYLFDVIENQLSQFTSINLTLNEKNTELMMNQFLTDSCCVFDMFVRL